MKLLVNSKTQLKGLYIFLLFTHFSVLAEKSDSIFQIQHKQNIYAINPKLQILTENTNSNDPDEILKKDFIRVENFSEKLKTKQNYWLKIHLKNHLSQELKVYLDLGIWSYIDYYLYSPEENLRQEKTGHFLPLQQRIDKNFYPYYIPIQIPKQKELIILVKIRQEMAFYLPEKLEASLLLDDFLASQNRQRLLYQGIFLGVIFVMALYNFLIYFSVRDISFLYYVLSIIGVGLYFMFYYGFTMELLWGRFPIWNAYSFAFIVPLTRITWVFFTKTYLNLKEIMPLWNKRLNILIYLYMVPIVLGAINLFSGYDLTVLTVDWIGVMGVIVLTMMLLMGYLALKKGYKPARFFLIANLVFSLGSILFILREVGFLHDNFMTRYAVQIGVIIQVILFSLGLADRLNTAREEIVQKDLEKERLEREKEIEKKQLIENQKKQLEIDVQERTADLKEKTEELEIAIHQLQESEKNLKELNHIKDKFFSIISHDLRSPLATLNSFLNILVNFSDNFSKEDMHTLAQKTRQSVNNLSDLLDNLLQWAMSQMHQQEFSPQIVNLKAISQESINLLSVTANEKQIEIRQEIPTHLMVYTDYNMLSFILRNLLINALKFTPRAGKICISASEEDGLVFIHVKDNGIGINEENINQLLDSKIHFSTRGTQNEKGVGLGFMLCKEFIEKSGGNIQIQSKPDHGTTIIFWLPSPDEK